MAGDLRVGDRVVHQFTRAAQLVGQLGLVADDRRERLIEDLISPLCLKQPRLTKPHQKITQRPRIQDVGVVQGDERHGR